MQLTTKVIDEENGGIEISVYDMLNELKPHKNLDIYMLYGGMPRLLAMKEEKDKKDYLVSLYSKVYIKDIVERNGIEREDIRGDILDSLASQISSLTNPANIANALTSIKKEMANG